MFIRKQVRKMNYWWNADLNRWEGLKDNATDMLSVTCERIIKFREWSDNFNITIVM